MRRALQCLCLLMLLLCQTARAQGVDEILSGLDVSSWQEMEQDAGAGALQVGEMLRALARGETWGEEAWGETLIKRVTAQFQSAAPLLLTLLVPALLWGLLNQLMGGEQRSAALKAAERIYALGTGCMLLASFLGQAASAREAILRMTALSEHVSPVLMTLLSATGGGSSAGALNPMAALAATLMTKLAGGVSIALSTAAAVLSVCGNVSRHLKLRGLFKLCESVNNWMLGIVMTAFLGMMTVKGMLGRAYDGASIRTARYAVDNLMPIVGGEVANTLDVLVSSALLVKNAAGVTGMALLVSVALEPVARLVAMLLAMKLSGALAEPVADGPIAQLLAEFGSVLRMLLIALVTTMVLFVVLVGAVLSTGQAIVMLR